ncbi:MAG: hypothetical protein ACXQTP_05440 [Candidatus Methanofastidiosia archaeon]
MDYILKIVLIISAYIIVSIIGAFFIKLLLGRYEKDVENGGLESAGLVIGILERIMVLTFVLVDQYTAITLIFAAKSIARFNELKERKMAEYYLIGTLISIAFAMIVGIIVRLIIWGRII